ncbi:MAG: LON peptidase substrate-binding domain-containing protein, partial [Clostridia bacterium]|nr:LON peptidase substrate-binding domain-containing protein [Clostridia bacterium]
MSVNLIYKEIPTVALRGLVVFPDMRLHFEVGRQKSIAAFRAAVTENQKIFLVTQKSIACEDPTEEDLFPVGVLATVKQIIKSPDNKNIRVVVEGICRASATEFLPCPDYLLCNVKERKSTSVKNVDKDYIDALVRKTKDIFESYIDIT